MSLEDLVNSTITATTVTPTRENFGTTLVACYKVPTASGKDFVNPATKVVEYSQLKGMTDGGFLVTDPAYIAASAVFAQSPRPKTVKIGRRALSPTVTWTLVCTDATEGAVYSIDINSVGNAVTTLTYTVPAAQTTTQVAAAIELLTEAVTGINSTSSTATITVVAATATDQFRLKNWTSNFQVTETTADPGLATDLAAILAYDDDWYGLAIDSVGKAENVVAATWAESNKKLFGATTCDYAVKTSSTSDVASTVNASALARTYVLYNGNDSWSFAAAAWQGDRFPSQPGSDSWAYKTLAGVTRDRLTSGERTYVLNKKASVYETVSGVNITEFGKVAGGEYIDVVRFIDWLNATMKVEIFAYIASREKVPFDQSGLDEIEGVVRSVIKQGIKAKGIVPGSETVTMPVLADISTLSKGNRTLPDIEWQATLTGAIHIVDPLTGRLSL